MPYRVQTIKLGDPVSLLPSTTQRCAFRVDASLEIGSGHMMRCLTLADALARAGHECHFLTRAAPGNSSDLIVARGHTLHPLEQTTGHGYGDHSNPPTHAAWLGASWQEDTRASARILSVLSPEWLIVDHYALERDWEAVALPLDSKLMVIDDLADRAHVCDILLDQNLGRQDSDYDGLVPDHCKRLIGPEFALLRPEFRQLRKLSALRRQNPRLEHILITLGGVDKDNVTSRVLDVLAKCNLPRAAHITVVMGAKSPALEAVQQAAAKMPLPAQVLVSIDNMAEIMASADLAIGAAGSTSWERCCLGLPTLMLTIADNQIEVASALDRLGGAILLGDAREPVWGAKLKDILDNLGVLALVELAQNSLELTQGNGSDLITKEIRVG